MDIHELIAEGLKRRGFVGLVNDDVECSCDLSDLIPCGLDCMSNTDCVASPAGAVFPKVVCLCGSTRFWQTFFDVGFEETLKGHIVLSIGVARHVETEDGGHVGEVLGPEVCAMLDELHKRKIDLADEVIILNVGGYIGDSTRSELEYARATGKPVRFLEPVSASSV